MGGDANNEELAVTRAGYSAGSVVGISSGTDKRGVADSPELLIRHPTRRRGCSDIAVNIARDGTNST